MQTFEISYSLQNCILYIYNMHAWYYIYFPIPITFAEVSLKTMNAMNVSLPIGGFKKQSIKIEEII